MSELNLFQSLASRFSSLSSVSLPNQDHRFSADFTTRYGCLSEFKQGVEKTSNCLISAHEILGPDISFALDIDVPEKKLKVDASSENARALAIFRILVEPEMNDKKITITFNEYSSNEYVKRWAHMAGEMMSAGGHPVSNKVVSGKEVHVQCSNHVSGIIFELANSEGWFGRAVKMNRPTEIPDHAQLVSGWLRGVKGPSF